MKTLDQFRDPMTAAEVAKFFRCNLEIIYRFLSRGKLVGYKPTNEWRIFKADVLAYLESRRYKARQPAPVVDRQHEQAMARLRARGLRV